jgi:hypothetical protein
LRSVLSRRRRDGSDHITIPAEGAWRTLSFRLGNGAGIAISPASQGGMRLAFVKNGQAPLSATLFAVEP